MSDFYSRSGDSITYNEWVDETSGQEQVIDQADVADAVVTTSWTGINDNVMSHEPPWVYKTFVAGGRLNGHTNRYATEAEAREGHGAMKAAIKDESDGLAALLEAEGLRDALRVVAAARDAHVERFHLYDWGAEVPGVLDHMIRLAS